MPQFEVVRDDPPEVATTEPADSSKALDVLLAIFSQKTATALHGVFALVTVALVFWISYVIIPNNPSVQQLIGLGGFAVFVVAVNIIVRRK